MKKVILGLLSFVAVSCSTTTKEVAVVPDKEEKSVEEVLLTRRSVRQYTSETVSRKVINEILNCGIHAPSAINRQSWEIRVVDDPKFIEGARDIYVSLDSSRVNGVSHTFPNAPVYVFVAQEKSFEWSSTDCGLLCGNICNAAWGKGLGTVIMGSTARAFVGTPELQLHHQRLGFSEGYSLMAVIALGYPDETPDVKPRDTSKIRFIEPLN